ncbi:MAG: monovalent cation/H+ antiporter subunit D family protein [Deltaproteobacteria bacterium]
MSLYKHLPILLIVTPLIAAYFIPIIARIKAGSAWYVATAALSATSAISVMLLRTVLHTGRISYHFGGWEPPWGIEYAIDYLNGFVVVIVSLITLAVAVYAKKSVEKEIDKAKIPAFYSIYLLFYTGLTGMVVTGDMFNLYVFIEISALAGYALTAIGRKRGALLASYNYLILGTIGATFILIGIGYLYVATGSLNMGDLRARLPLLYDSHAVRTAFAFLTVGLALKLALFPFHIWLPGVYSQAPSVVSVIMSATSSKVSAYVLLRVMFSVFTVKFDLESVPITRILLLMSSVSIIVSSVLAISQTNIKRMLAYSSVGQIGYIIFGAALMNRTSLGASLLHILNHALMKGTLFMAAGAMAYTVGAVEISDLKGMGKKMPFTAAAFTIAALSMIGVPLTAGFVSKWYLAVGAMESGMWFFIPILLVSSMLMAVYFWRVMEIMYFQKETGDDRLVYTGRQEAPAGMVAPMLVMAGLCVFFGVYTAAPVEIVFKASEILLRGM